MQFQEDSSSRGVAIQAYSESAIMVNGERHSESLIITNTAVLGKWPVTTADDISLESLEAVVATQPDVILIGTGLTLVWPDQDVRDAALRKGIGIECMTTPAACRAFNIMASDGRKVTAALLIASA